MNKNLYRKLAEQLPTIWQRFEHGIEKACRIFDEIKSFDDIERVFFLARGLAPQTYRSYLISVRMLYNFLGGKHPLKITVADIEKFYDSLFTHRKVKDLVIGEIREYNPLAIDSAYQKIKGLKRFFKSVEEVVPFYESPFKNMTERLSKKLNQTTKGNRKKKVLTPTEIKELKIWLSKDHSLKGMRDYAIVYFLLTSGLRATELCRLKWKNLECVDGKWTAYFIGMGGKLDEQELFAPAVEAVRRCFKKAVKRDPAPEDPLFWTLSIHKNDKPRPMQYMILWRRVKEIGKAAMAVGVIKRNIKITPQICRNSYATVLYKSGMKVVDIQEKTRHTSVDALVKRYIDSNESAESYLAKVFT